MKNTILHRGFFSRLAWGVSLVSLLFVTAPLCAQDIQVDSADPSSAEQGTYDLEVTVAGNNFGPDSEVDFFVTGTANPGGIKVKKVKRKNPKTLKVTVDVAPDAQTELDFDIEVRSRGRTGKGTELFRVLKKQEIQELWELTIPYCGDPGLNDFNLCGWNTTTYVQTGDAEEDGFHVSLSIDNDNPTAKQDSRFTLVVLLCEWPMPCFNEAQQPDQITFRNFVFGDFEVTGDGPPCIFPEQTMSECEDVVAPDCLQCFINGEHPYTRYWPWPARDGTDYTWIYLRITVPGSVEDIQPGEAITSSGHLEMKFRGQNMHLETGYEYPHFVRTDVDLPSDAVTITRVGDSWTVDVTVNQITFFEGYRGCATRNSQGKCIGGKGEGPYPLWADIAEPLHFRGTWTRFYSY